MTALIVKDATHPARALFGMAKVVRSIADCLDGVFTLEGALQILREKADPKHDREPYGATILFEGEGGFLYQTSGGVTFGLLPINQNRKNFLVEGNSFGEYLLVLGFPREGSVINEGLALWKDHSPEVVDIPEGEAGADAVRHLWNIIKPRAFTEAA